VGKIVVGPARRPQLHALTSLRFFAALHVVLFHGQDYIFPSLGGREWLRNLIATGQNSVSFFFVLSGFILAYTYLGPPQEGRLRRGPFWAARFARVYPVYFFGLLVATPIVILGFLHDGATLGRFAVAAATVVTLVQSWAPQFALAWNGPGWSLSVEAFFYLVFPFLAPALWPLGRRGLLVCLALFWGLAQVGPALHALAPAGGWLGIGNAPPDFWVAVQDNVPYERLADPWSAVVQYDPLVRLPEFLFGVALGRLHLWDAAGPSRSIAWSAAAVAGAAALLAALALGPAVIPATHYLFFKNGLLAPLDGLLIYGLARARDGSPSRWLSVGLLVVLGEASYALYILHLPLRFLMQAAARALSGASQLGWPFFAVYVAAAVLVSVLVLRRVEEPARRFLRRR
jgi:peptidoglycan/LPS O-acetylase OafA/YrhL